MKKFISYSRWRAILALILPFCGLAIPFLNWAINPGGFNTRYVDDWPTSIPMAFALLWFMYALWPSAVRLLARGPGTVRLDGERITLDSGPSYRLVDLKGVEILRPLLQRPRVALRFSEGELIIETAYQTFGMRKSADSIAHSIAEASRSLTAVPNQQG